ncbi:uncharacterized protein KGF55_001782 [Candida pseudojiufengensis]|uniref:uncharacterized protein n=1 Tax=Candida pseudojiufengensis TaxID=497109 RepID=UPI0022241AF4|nr:uncharacterized protein KGF55_001782 [Candida pseudojiufengensis]KAI5964713.1 hypothetical protein KGF55_001782 [Candida pseudojiufengensis]
MSNTSTSNWSFSFYEESYDETYVNTSEEIEDAEDLQLNPNNKFIPNESSEIDNNKILSQYNPFIIAKLNSIKRFESKCKSNVYNKKLIISAKDVKETLKNASSNKKDILLWKDLTDWINRKGNPSTILTSFFKDKTGADNIVLSKEHQNSWTTFGVVQNTI